MLVALSGTDYGLVATQGGGAYCGDYLECRAVAVSLQITIGNLLAHDLSIRAKNANHAFCRRKPALQFQRVHKRCVK
ncbi:hypothetical protein WJX79_003879 [Trebouxia sp. C0005]